MVTNGYAKYEKWLTRVFILITNDYAKYAWVMITWLAPKFGFDEDSFVVIKISRL